MIYGIEKLFYWTSVILAIFFLFVFLRKPKRISFFKKREAKTGVQHHNKARKAHAILGIAPGATEQEIIRAYKMKMKQYHPDIVAHKGKAYKQRAKEYTLLIQKAKEELLGGKGEKEK